MISESVLFSPLSRSFPDTALCCEAFPSSWPKKLHCVLPEEDLASQRERMAYNLFVS